MSCGDVDKSMWRPSTVHLLIIIFSILKGFSGGRYSHFYGMVSYLDP
uniref:Uncharacterized protein n=1 Tax=Arundo donax TaxID=35708 RepID=A0A0A9AQK8_ARUDO